MKALEPIDVIPSENSGPYAIKTKLGQCIVHPVNGIRSRQEIHYNRIAVKQANTKDVGKHYFQTKTSVEENDVRDMLTRLYNLEFIENGPTEGKLETSMSREDQKFMKILQEGTKLRNGHYQVPLPFKDPYVNLPNNRYQARQRFSYLEKKFSKNDQFKEDYIRFMKDIIAKGYARKSMTEAASGKTWYLPHHGVYHLNKPRQIRVVFDLSADYKGRCLNRELLSGQDLTNQIVEVLLRFREEQIPVMGDTEAMFHQVKFPKDQCSFRKFLWWEYNDPDKEIIDYEMTAHAFNGTSSPSCSNFALRRTAKEMTNNMARKLHILERSFYVDDLLKNFPMVNKTVNAIKQL